MYNPNFVYLTGKIILKIQNFETALTLIHCKIHTPLIYIDVLLCPISMSVCLLFCFLQYIGCVLCRYAYFFCFLQYIGCVVCRYTYLFLFLSVYRLRSAYFGRRVGNRSVYCRWTKKCKSRSTSISSNNVPIFESTKKVKVLLFALIPW